MANRLGVVGAGGISRFHFNAFAELGHRVVIICDLKQANAQAQMDRFGAEYTADYRAVIAHPEVDAVIVLGPSPLHYEVVKAALEAGKHVVCEKTLSLSGATSLELGRLAEAKGVCLFTSYMKRWFPAARQALALMPKLGHVYSVYCRTYQGWGGQDMHTGPLSPALQGGPDAPSPVMRMAGGGVLICGGSHIFDLLLFLVGKPTAVFANMTTPPEADCDIMTHAMFEFGPGSVGHFEGNWHPLSRIGFEKRGWDEGFEINGVGGRLILQTPIWDQPEHNAPILRFYDNATGAWTEYSYPIVIPFTEAERHFQDDIAANEQRCQDRYTGYRVDLLLEMTAKSAARGKRVEIAWEA